MDTVLLILGILGLGAVVISAYVFTVSARNYVSNGHHDKQPDAGSPPGESTFLPRADSDRRRRPTEKLTFPMTVNGILVQEDRRRFPDRRAVA